MCAVSAVGDNWGQRFPNIHPWYPVNPNPNPGGTWPPYKPPNQNPILPIDPAYEPKVVGNVIPDLSKFATKEDIEALRKEMLELKELLKAAIKYDEMTNQPHCEQEEKIALIKQVAAAVGVDLSDLNLE